VVVEDLTAYQLALGAIFRGEGTIADSDMITNAVNACAAICIQHDWFEHLYTATNGQNAQKAMTDRMRKGIRMLYTGLEMQAIKDALALYETQVPLMTPKDMTRAANLVNKVLIDQRFIKPA
jgi:hypothetical protein